jgi:glycosyl transferase family 9 (putative heptosyltransferase)
VARRALELGALMGYGDEIIGSGLARGAAQRGKRIAFGDGRHIFWSQQAHEIYKNNPNVAPPGSEYSGAADLEWIEYYKGRRFYGEVHGGRWHFKNFRCPPGEIWFDGTEVAEFKRDWPQGLPVSPIIIEPAVKSHGACIGVNKQWPIARYVEVARALARQGHWVICLGRDEPPRTEIPRLLTPTFRAALLVLSMAKLYIGPEGGMHHGAAALGVQAVVIFGGFNTPKSTGYPWHTNLTADGEPCGMITECPHCAEAMRSISVERVLAAAEAELARTAMPPEKRM